MASIYDRLLLLEKKHLEEGMELSAEQIAKIEHYNPLFKERHVESSQPGELLCQDTFYVGHLKEVGKVYLHAVVNSYSSYAFGFLYNEKQAECAATVLHNDVLPFYAEHKLRVDAILTDNGPEFCGTPRTNGFIERFNRTVLDEFFRIAFRKKYYESLETLQDDLDAWLIHYNTERPHRGYRNMGRTPIATVQLFIDNDRHEP
jgi:transposase InsO family protein